jgi:opacity protein-like surface antigen
LNRSIFAAALAGIALVAFPIESRAQMSTVVKPFQIGVAAGAALPMSDFSDFFNTGFNGTLTLGLNPALIPLGIRIDGAYNQFGAKDVDGSSNVSSLTGNLVYSMPSTGVSPYLIGGVGVYRIGLSDELGGDSENDFGWNIGAGIKMPLSGFDTFIEARYNQVQTQDISTKFIPITFGIMF